MTDAQWNQIKGNWKQLVGSAKKQWADMTDDEWLKLEGDRDKLVGMVQEKYGKSQEEAEKQVTQWQNSQA